ncbi:MAG: tRNA (adenosine(37)-N6)-threonylcarbamoyltransferase complex dimerization subunit type 1 TsaB [Acidobacteria bacterium]|nr:MAG: tRNA (adenosine(37)-N6)-threonylcarbamoyltransferase complex dimerization subunit type 1 TsaB [Acidobacteriota bacterium]
MRILALDTSTAAGSAALAEDGRVTIARAGDGSRTHGERLPLELMALLGEAHVPLAAIDRFAVAIGPGSFTGLRVGIATIQGLAFAKHALVVPVSTFEALAWRAKDKTTAIAAWIDAHRGEVFASLFAPDGTAVLQPPSSLTPEKTLEAWRQALAACPGVRFTGDGAIKYEIAIRQALGEGASIEAETPILAGAIAEIAAADPSRAVRPHAVVPLYVRRPDAELARDRRRALEIPQE